MNAVDERQQQMIFEKLEKLALTDSKKYVRIREGKIMFSMGETKLREMAKEAQAVRKINGMVLINVSILYDYIEKVYS